MAIPISCKYFTPAENGSGKIISIIRCENFIPPGHEFTLSFLLLFIAHGYPRIPQQSLWGDCCETKKASAKGGSDV